jgi:uncharacterized lipoprotein NlpE involved in copper resistance
MKKIILATLTTVALTTFSCKSEKEDVKNEVETTIDSTKIEATTAEKLNQYEGTYNGTLPCFTNDCKEVEVEIKLLPNKGYVYSTKRLGVDKDKLMTTGTFHFEKDGNTIVLPEIANVPNAFFVENGKIIQLDKDQKRIETADSAKFELIKK